MANWFCGSLELQAGEEVCGWERESVCFGLQVVQGGFACLLADFSSCDEWEVLHGEWRWIEWMMILALGDGYTFLSYTALPGSWVAITACVVVWLSFWSHILRGIFTKY